MKITQVKITVDFKICGTRIKKGDIIFLTSGKEAILSYVEEGEMDTLLLTLQSAADLAKILANGCESKIEMN